MDRPSAPISVVIPHHNRSHLIEASLASVARQTLKPAEIIIVDDASNPEHRSKVLEYSNTARVICLSKNAGPAQARNAGIEAARQEFISFLDDDDTWLPDKLEAQWKLIEQHSDLSAITSAFIVFNDDGTEWVMRGHSPEIITLEAALEATPALLQTMLIRSTVIRALQGFDTTFRQFEDQDFWIRFTAAGYKARHLREPLMRLNRCSGERLTEHWWSYTSAQLQVVAKHRALYKSVLGAGAARIHCSRYIRRSGMTKGRVLGRAVYAAGCILGGEFRPLLKLITSGKLADVGYSKPQSGVPSN